MRMILVTFLFTFSVIVWAQKKKQLPPGTVKVDENLYLDIAEISNFAWNEYRYWLKRKYGENSKEYLESALDTSVWRTKQMYNEPFAKYYHSHPAFKEYPAVGMSYEQAVAYCKWRSDRVNELFYVKENKLKLHPDSNYNYSEIVRYRLPSKQEWERFAAAGFDKKTLKKAKKKDFDLYNYYKTDTTNLATSMDLTAPVISYFPDKNGAYNLLGNVAEMIDEKGIAKGGSYIHSKEEINFQNDIKYDVPTCFIGFRCVAEFVK